MHQGASPRIAASPRIPLASWLLGLPGIVALLAGGGLLVADDAALPPVLAGPGAALVLIVSAVALLGSATFPFILARLSARDDRARLMQEGRKRQDQ